MREMRDEASWRTERGPLVYGLLDPTTGELRYVGKTHGRLARRVKAHLREATTDRVNHRLSWLRSLPEPPAVIVLARTGPEHLAAMEIALIARARTAGRWLVNSTDGGEGMLNPTAETRAKLRARSHPPIPQEARDRGRETRWERDRLPDDERERRKAEQAERYKLAARKDPAIPHGNAGRPKTDEHRRKLADATRAHLAQHGHPRAGRQASDETKAKLRAAWERRKARA